MTSSVSLPLVVWHGFSNPNITCIAYSHPNIYAGQRDGHIWVYTIKDNSLQVMKQDVYTFIFQLYQHYRK